MAHCARCNRFMLFNTQTGYCNNCYEVIAAEEQRKQEKERKLKEEAARQKAEEERKRKEQVLRKDGVYYTKNELTAERKRYSYLRFYPEGESFGKVIYGFASDISTFTRVSKQLLFDNLLLNNSARNYSFFHGKVSFTSHDQRDEVIEHEFSGTVDNNTILMSDKRTYYNDIVKTFNNITFSFISDDEIINGRYLQQEYNHNQEQQTDMTGKEKLKALKSRFLDMLGDLLMFQNNMAAVRSIYDLEGVDRNTYQPLIDKAIDLKREEKYIEACNVWFSILMRTNSLASSIIDSWAKTLIVAGDITDAAVLALIQRIGHNKNPLYPETIAQRIEELRLLANDRIAFMSRLQEYSGNNHYSMQASAVDVLMDPNITDEFVNHYSGFTSVYVIPLLSCT